MKFESKNSEMYNIFASKYAKLFDSEEPEIDNFSGGQLYKLANSSYTFCLNCDISYILQERNEKLKYAAQEKCKGEQFLDNFPNLVY